MAHPSPKTQNYRNKSKLVDFEEEEEDSNGAPKTVMAHPSPKTQNYRNKSKLVDFEEEEEDRISSLPDEILCHILSFMPTKYAFRTSLLSTRWKPLWTFVPTIDFYSDTWEYPKKAERSSFMDFGDRVMLLHNLPTINKFHLQCEHGYYDQYRLSSWICTAIKLNVQELVLRLNPGQIVVELPRNLFTSVNLVILKLECNVFFRVATPVFLPSLKVLHLSSYTILDEDFFENFLSGCPVLEELDIDRGACNNVKTLCICSSTLKKLRICTRFSKERKYPYGVVIKTPALEILRLMDFVPEVFDVNEFPSLVKAHLSVPFHGYDSKINDDYSNGVVGMLGKISNVQDLQLCHIILKAVIQSSAYDLLFFHNLTHLDVDIYDIPWSILPDLLGHMPHLKALSFYKDSQYCKNCKWRGGPKSVPVPNCLSHCLETVEFGGFVGCKEEMKLVKYLLKNAVVLKKVVLKFWSMDKKMKANIQELPRRSTTCQIELRCSFRPVEWL